MRTKAAPNDGRARTQSEDPSASPGGAAASATAASGGGSGVDAAAAAAPASASAATGGDDAIAPAAKIGDARVPVYVARRGRTCAPPAATYRGRCRHRRVGRPWGGGAAATTTAVTGPRADTAARAATSGSAQPSRPRWRTTISEPINMLCSAQSCQCAGGYQTRFLRARRRSPRCRGQPGGV